MPSELPGARFPATVDFLRRQVDMQVADLRVLFRLAAPELDSRVGCNVTTGAVLLNVLSGFRSGSSKTDVAEEITQEEERQGKPLSRRRFTAFVEAYWPPQAGPPSPDVVGQRLYEV